MQLLDSSTQIATILDLTSVSSATLPSWADATGTVYLEDGAGNKRAIGWSPSGYTTCHNGATIDAYPPAFILPPCSASVTYYVDATLGVDTQAGTSIATAWKTLAKVNAQSFAAGTVILFKRGETWNEKLVVPTSGTSGNFIKYSTYGTGARAKFDGQLVRGHCVDTNTKNYLWFNGIHCTRSTGVGNDSVLRDENGCWQIGPTPTGITLTDCEASLGAKTGFRVMTISTDIRLKDCISYNNGKCGMYAGPSNYSHDMHFNLITAFCTFYGNGTAGPWLDNNWMIYPANSGRIYGCTIRDLATNNSQLYFNRQDATGNSQYAFHIHNNEIYGTGYTCIASKTNCYVYRNLVHNTTGYAQDHSEANGKPVNVYTHHNLYHTLDVGIFEGGANGNEIAGGSFTLHMWNNTIDNITTGANDIGIYVYDTTQCTTAVMKNNIISNCGMFFKDRGTSAAAGTINYNLYYNASAAQKWERGGVSTGVFATWQGWGYDANTVNGSSPLYVGGGSYALQAGSPARSIGLDAIPLVSTQPHGWIGYNFVPHATSPDAGAYQYLSGKALNSALVELQLVSLFMIQQRQKPSCRL